MATLPSNNEPTRPIASYEDHEGNLRAISQLSPKANNTRGAVGVPPIKVMPVIVVPGIMGSNLRAHVNPAEGKNEELNPGEEAWRPPNGVEEGLAEVKKWNARNPAVRQKILDGDTLEVDPNGAIPLGLSTDGFVWDEKIAKQRGWGEIHLSSYGSLLVTLQRSLNSTYRFVGSSSFLEDDWIHVNGYDRGKWGASAEEVVSPLTNEEFKKFSQFHYPVYAFGYNWLKSNEVSAQSLQRKIEMIIAYWKERQKECNAVLLVTHSMGGLVARACAQKIPQMIAGVVHGAMPAIGAPVCFRRLACGTETGSPTDTSIGTEKFAEIAGLTIAETTPVLATAAGPLELLPNHTYPRPWLFAQSVDAQNKPVFMNLSDDDPYLLYLNFTSWYRLIDPAFADPANKYKGNVKTQIANAVLQAKKFHTEILKDNYHPRTFVFYGADPTKLSFGSFRWKLPARISNLPESALKAAQFTRYLVKGGRQIEVGPSVFIDVMPSVQDVRGDGTVPHQSGIAPTGKVKHIFATKGYSHQECYGNSDMLALTRHLIVKLMQEV